MPGPESVFDPADAAAAVERDRPYVVTGRQYASAVRAVLDAHREALGFLEARLSAVAAAEPIAEHRAGAVRYELWMLARLAAGRWRGNPLAALVACSLLRALAQLIAAGHRPDSHADPAAPPARPPTLLALTCSTMTAAPPARPVAAVLGAAAA